MYSDIARVHRLIQYFEAINAPFFAAKMRKVLISMILTSGLVACAKPGSSPEAVTCNNVYAGAFEEIYPDGISRKSEVAACSNGCNKVTAVGDPSQTFNQCH